MSTAEIKRVLDLSAVERIELMGILWDSLLEVGYSPELSEAQHLELDRRLDSLEREGSKGISWEEARRIVETRGRQQ